ncbi:MAG: hypothetical protein HFJ31_03110, partial [Clostridia bacterium]|nr:hypothetical protein [Clostridia bacterium]
VEEGERPATNSKGEILGTKEIINGKEYYTVSTNSQGEIVADLTEGLYKAVEVEAPDKYDISNNTYYFGIGTSREGIQGVQTEWSKSVGGNNFDRITCITKTSEGGYIVGGYFNSSNIILGNNIELNSNSTYYYTGMIIKYGNDGEVEWGRTITGNQMQQITCIEETNDGGYIVGGYFTSRSIDLGNGIVMNNKGWEDGMIIKYDSNGNVEWGKAVGGSSSDYITCIIKTNDGGYIIGGYFKSSSIELENGVILNNNGSFDGMIIKYKESGKVEWGKEIGGSSDDRITCITETIDGDYVVGGHFSSSSIDLESQITLNNNGERDGMIIKYGSNGKIEWGNVVGGKKSEQITCITNAKEGGYVVGGHFSSSSLNFENGTELNNKGSSDGMIIKYGSNGEVEWGNVIGGNKDDEITSIIETSEGGYIAVGNFMSSNIRLQNKVELINYGYRDGMIVKCSKSGIIEWGSKVGGENNDQINSIIEISNRSYIVGGDFESTSIKLENGTELNNKGKSDGIIIRYNIIDKPEIKIKQGKSIGGSEEDQITCIVETQDGGYLVGGYFRSSSIDLGNGEVLTNKSSSTAYSDGMIIKYGSDGNVEWRKAVGGSSDDRITCITETIDGGYIVGGYFKSETIYIENGVVLYNHRINYYDGMIIKYSESGEVEWGKVVNGTNNDYIICITKAQDGGYVVGGYFNSSSIDLGNGIVLNNRSGYNDVMIIKYNERGNIEWGKTLGGDRDDEITCIVETRDGGYAIGGYFDSSSIDLGNGVVLTNKSSSTAYSDGMIIKYSTDGKVEWGKVVGGSSYDYISCITEAKDGGYVVGGYFKSNSIDLGNGVVINSKDNNINYSDGMIIKYDEGGNLEWGKEIGGTGSDQITCITESSDRGYVLGGYFDSSSIDLGNGVVLKNKVTNGSSDGMIIKYKESGKVE